MELFGDDYGMTSTHLQSQYLVISMATDRNARTGACLDQFKTIVCASWIRKGLRFGPLVFALGSQIVSQKQNVRVNMRERPLIIFIHGASLNAFYSFVDQVADSVRFNHMRFCCDDYGIIFG